jgi:hypothetical protein
MSKALGFGARIKWKRARSISGFTLPIEVKVSVFDIGLKYHFFICVGDER